MTWTDYRHPPEWDSFSDEEKSDWYTRERCRRQTLRQDTKTARILRKQIGSGQGIYLYGRDADT